MNNKIVNYVRTVHETKVDHMKYIQLQNVRYMKYTTNSNNFHLHIKLEMNENNLIKKKLIVNNVTFKMTRCGYKGYFDWELRK